LSVVRIDKLTWTGSPNVQGFAYFLIQHKAELGNMYLDKIQVFKGETRAELPCISSRLARRRRSRNETMVMVSCGSMSFVPSCES
jgi:hypothetical protein